MSTLNKKQPEAKRSSTSIWAKLKMLVNKVGTLNIVLIVVFGFFIWFNWQMLAIYTAVGSIPETYACAVIAATIGECGICGWIRTNKDKKQDRLWAQQDEVEPTSKKEVPPDGGTSD